MPNMAFVVVARGGCFCFVGERRCSVLSCVVALLLLFCGESEVGVQKIEEERE